MTKQRAIKMVDNLRDNTVMRLKLAEMHETLEHVTELLVDTWATAMEGQPELEMAVVKARILLAPAHD